MGYGDDDRYLIGLRGLIALRSTKIKTKQPDLGDLEYIEITSDCMSGNSILMIFDEFTT